MIAILPASNPTVLLNNNVKMPLLAAGTWQYDNNTAGDSIAKAYAAGFTHFDTAEDYDNQLGVGMEIKKLLASGVKRESLFITTKTMPCHTATTLKIRGRDFSSMRRLTRASCFNQTTADFALDLKLLGLDYVDLVLLHGPSTRGTSTTTECNAQSCDADLGSWQALEQAYAERKVRAIGVSNYCQSCFECLLSKATTKPSINQIAFHVGMGDDPSNLVSFSASKGILVQAYSPLGDGSLPGASDLAAIGQKYNKSAAQVALKWIVDKGLPVVTKADSAQYLREDIDLWSWNLTKADTATLSANRKYPSSFGPSWACKKR
jgi:diketogulonate reductase-like aldo/keto reductase